MCESTPPSDPSYLALLAFASRVRTCEHSGACCRAQAAELLGEPVGRCPECGHATLPDVPCPCLQYLGQPSNPAAAAYHAASRV